MYIEGAGEARARSPVADHPNRLFVDGESTKI